MDITIKLSEYVEFRLSEITLKVDYMQLCFVVDIGRPIYVTCKHSYIYSEGLPFTIQPIMSLTQIKDMFFDIKQVIR